MMRPKRRLIVTGSISIATVKPGVSSISSMRYRRSLEPRRLSVINIIIISTRKYKISGSLKHI